VQSILNFEPSSATASQHCRLLPLGVAGAIVLDEDEEGVVHLPWRELDAVDNFLQQKRVMT
jgi:hypothetical protein